MAAVEPTSHDLADALETVGNAQGPLSGDFVGEDKYTFSGYTHRWLKRKMMVQQGVHVLTYMLTTYPGRIILIGRLRLSKFQWVNT